VRGDIFRKIRSDTDVLGISRLYSSARYILVGFSGGADSSLLLEYFVYLRDVVPGFPEIRAVHVNHMLRGEESYNDEEFCRDRCESLGIPLTVSRIDIPRLMEESGLGAEECARNERYKAFAAAADELGGDGVLIATAHNADDNLETVLFNLARGTGASGLSGIPPVRGGNVIRPLLGMGSAEIRAACRSMNIPFVIDRTNTDEEYTRNFIRHSVAPLLKKVNPAAADSALRAGVTLREDEEFFRRAAKDALREYLPADENSRRVALRPSAEKDVKRPMSPQGSSGERSWDECETADENSRRTALRPSAEVPRDVLSSLAPPVLSRAVMMLTASVTDVAMSAAQVQRCRRLITETGTGTVSLADGVTFEVSKNFVTVTKGAFEPGEFSFSVELPKKGECLKYSCPEGGFDLYLARSEGDLLPEGENIYKLSINTAVRFDTIYGKVFARSRLPGDTLFLGGHTRRLKKMICDRGIPVSMRARLPVICDDDGVLLVPGLPVRGPAYARECDHPDNVLFVTYCLHGDFQ